jgi:predicted GNAT family N-acyltransferase
MTSVQIRRYTESDRTDCLQVFKSNIPKYFAPHELSEFEEFLDRVLIQTKDAHYSVLLLDDKLIGCGGYGERLDSDSITLIWGMIDAEYHKQGYGVQLLKHRLNGIIEDYPHQEVLIDTTQYSAGFFEHYGFKTIKVIQDYYEQGMHRYDMVLTPS